SAPAAPLTPPVTPPPDTPPVTPPVTGAVVVAPVAPALGAPVAGGVVGGGVAGLAPPAAGCCALTVSESPAKSTAAAPAANSHLEANFLFIVAALVIGWCRRYRWCCSRRRALRAALRRGAAPRARARSAGSLRVSAPLHGPPTPAR